MMNMEMRPGMRMIMRLKLDRNLTIPELILKITSLKVQMLLERMNTCLRIHKVNRITLTTVDSPFINLVVAKIEIMGKRRERNAIAEKYS